MYGRVIKEIRLSKSLPVKSVYNGICSKTNALKFEKGDRILAANKFNQILENLAITMDEFLWIRDDYKPDPNVYRHYLISKSWNDNRNEDVGKKVNRIESEDFRVERVRLASYRLLRDHSRKNPVIQRELQIVVDYFSNISSWTLSDIKFFANNCYILPYSLMLGLVKEIVRVQDKYNFFPGSESVFAMVLTNSIDRMIDEGDFINAHSMIKLLNSFIEGIALAGYRLLSMYYEAKIDFLYGDVEQGKKQLLTIMNIATFLNEKRLMIEVQQLLRVFK